MREFRYGLVLLSFFILLSIFSGCLINGNFANTALDFVCRYSALTDIKSSGAIMLVSILAKNLLACALVALFSWLAYGLTIYMFILVNAAVLGIVFSIGGFSWETLSYFMPHAPFELAAIMLSLGMGWRILKSGQRPEKTDIVHFVSTVFPLLCLAALLETYLTPAFIAMAN